MLDQLQCRVMDSLYAHPTVAIALPIGFPTCSTMWGAHTFEFTNFFGPHSALVTMRQDSRARIRKMRINAIEKEKIVGPVFWNG